MFVALGVVIVTVGFGLVTYFLKTQKDGKKRPVALDPRKKIPFKLIDKKVSLSTLCYSGLYGSILDAERISRSPVRVTKSPGYEGGCLNKVNIFTLILADFGGKFLDI